MGYRNTAQPPARGHKDDTLRTIRVRDESAPWLTASESHLSWNPPRLPDLCTNSAPFHSRSGHLCRNSRAARDYAGRCYAIQHWCRESRDENVRRSRISLAGRASLEGQQESPWRSIQYTRQPAFELLPPRRSVHTQQAGEVVSPYSQWRRQPRASSEVRLLVLRRRLNCKLEPMRNMFFTHLYPIARARRACIMRMRALIHNHAHPIIVDPMTFSMQVSGSTPDPDLSGSFTNRIYNEITTSILCMGKPCGRFRTRLLLAIYSVWLQE